MWMFMLGPNYCNKISKCLENISTAKSTSNAKSWTLLSKLRAERLKMTSANSLKEFISIRTRKKRDSSETCSQNQQNFNSGKCPPAESEPIQFFFNKTWPNICYDTTWKLESIIRRSQLHDS